jgi:RNA polymerase sigma-70 factor (ECF subfamily)
MANSPNPSTGLSAEVLLAHSAWLTRLARALVVSDDEIDDVVQQTYLQALAKPPRHTENLRAWLSAIARNIVRSRSRSDTSRVAREVAVAPPRPVEDPAEAVERAELRHEVVKAVLALDEPYRSSIILRFFEEKEVEAIGRMMGSGSDTVRTRIRRGVMRVREQLKRHVLDTSRDSADGGAAALAILFARLNRIAAWNGSAGSIGAPIVGRAVELRSAARSGASASVSANVSRVLVATAVIAAATGLWWRLRRPAPIQSETRTVEAARTPVTSTLPASASTAVERKDEASPATEARQPTVVTPPPVARIGTIRGVVSDPSGSPLAGAGVWALLCTSHREEYSISDFAGAASDQMKFEAEGRTLGNWVRTTSGIDGRYEITGLSMMPGWQVGVFSADVGAGLADVQSFDHDHRDLTVDVKLAPGTVLKGTVRDDDGHPIGNALALLYTTVGKQVKQETIVATASGPSVGEYKIDFRCGDLLELECRAPGFEWAPRSRVKLTARANETIVDFSLKRKPGNVVRGRIVDTAGHPLDLLAVLAEKFPAVKANARPFRVSVDAIPSNLDAATRKGPDRLPEGAVEGRVDYVAGVYEVILPDGFTGSLEIRIAHAVVGSTVLLSLERPPDLPCNADLVLGPATSKPFAIRYVDAESGLGIDLERELAPPRGNDGSYVAARPRSDSDLRHGLVIYSCASGFLKIEVGITRDTRISS